jgi:hypothetical protein
VRVRAITAFSLHGPFLPHQLPSPPHSSLIHRVHKKSLTAPFSFDSQAATLSFLRPRLAIKARIAMTDRFTPGQFLTR